MKELRSNLPVKLLHVRNINVGLNNLANLHRDASCLKFKSRDDDSVERCYSGLGHHHTFSFSSESTRRRYEHIMEGPPGIIGIRLGQKI